MGDYSRDTFRLTNVMHQLLTGEAVADARHYVGVRLQQGVPMLDADWNELEDVRRVEERLKLRDFFGNGIPAGNGGFRIGPVTEDNDFAIASGVAMVDGMLVVNRHAGLTYLGQATVFGIPPSPLSPPASGTRDDLVVLDVWEQQVGAADGSGADPRLVNPTVGLETCRRIERRWAVRVIEDATDLAAVTPEAGHSYMPLARLRRAEGEARIESRRIFDRRRKDLNVAEYLKVPVRVERGGVTVDSDRLAERLSALRTILMDRLAANQVFTDGLPTLDQTVIHFALQHVMEICSSGALQARTRNLTETDALRLMAELVAAQAGFCTALTDHGAGDTPTTDFVEAYREHLDGSEAVGGDAGLGGVRPPLAEDDLIGAYQGQQVLNAWLSAAGGTLPEGSVLARFLSITPFEAIDAARTYDVTIEIVSQAISDQGSEVFDVTLTLSSDLWSVDRGSAEITLTNGGGRGELTFAVTPDAGNAECTVSVRAEARRNPSVVHTPPTDLLLRIGEQPTVVGTLLYAGGLNDDGQVELNAGQLDFGLASAQFALNNSTDTDRSYTVASHLELSSGESTAPVERIISVSAEDVETVAINFGMPDGTTASAGDTGTLTVRLLRRNGVDLPADEQETVELPFLVV
ncbi:DUF6519 domain-containing protein [Halomonas ramblicola]|uniref:DUF6519 domain-containing protein n=1 Tax=Halomonas ramblicola TaxID=747349 RepID=UPI0025B5AFD4|nr:DUF6519 domain-containing protein [Halomonas ramblicola]MDN3522551.1 DUF6519 domain-containing protein [Halomonas ramblicola]